MIKNYLSIAFRNIRRNSLYSIINILGLSVGIACCLLILSYVRYELSFDLPHKKNDRIYRVYMDANFGGQQALIGVTPNIIAPILQSQFPEVEKVVRVYNIGKFRPQIVKVKEELYEEKNFYYADSSIFEIFTFQPVYGQLDGSLDKPNTLVLTQSASQKYFGNKNPVGSVVNVNGNTDYEITAVIEDMPNNVHFRFDMVGSFQGLSWAKPENLTFGSANFYTYVLLYPGADHQNFEDNVATYTENTYGGQWKQSGFFLTLKMEPLKDIYLRSPIDNDIDKKSDIRYVYIFSFIAILVLVIACINYMNLATARGSERAKEVGMRKMLGARKNELISQFMGESILITGFAIFSAIVMVELLMPVFRELSGRQLQNSVSEPILISSLAGIWIGVSLLAGFYPAVILSSFKPSKVLKGSFKSSAAGRGLRKILVVLQFAISIFLIAGTIVIFRQLDFIQNKKLGYDKDQVIAVPIDNKIAGNLDIFKNEFVSIPGVINVTAASETPSDVKGGYSYIFEGRSLDESMSVNAMAVDIDFIKTLGIEVVSGRDYSEDSKQKPDFSFIFNEAAASRSGLSIENLIGERISLNGRNGVVTGIMKDFHFTSMYREIGPLILFIEPSQFAYMMIKIDGQNIQQTLNTLATKWKTLASHRPFEYGFLDDEFTRLYAAEMKVGELFSVFAIVAIFIASLGLLGLAAYMASQRAKEISVRKVMGASVGRVVLLLSFDFARLVLIAFIISAPLAYYIMNNWLNEFVYRVSFGVETLLIAGLLAFIIAWGTVAWQAFKAATINPVDILRYE
ncbi:MAG TPA: ABC transporter permease [Cyclobacteriaceae bacterium]|jgi:putative ABC transport system permease protein